MRLLVSGPCGVGKSAAGAILASQIPTLQHLEVDLIRVERDGISVRSGCCPSDFDLEECMGDLLPPPPSPLALDIGGDTIFRRNVDNRARLRQLDAFADSHQLTIVLLEADREVLRTRFLSCKGRRPGEFDQPWTDWIEVGRPWWMKAADRVLDTGQIDLASPDGEAALVSLLHSASGLTRAST